MSRSRFVALAVLLVAAPACLTSLAGCKREGGDQDVLRRREWLHQQTKANDLFVRQHLTQPDDNHAFAEGWYATEYNPKTGGSWKWMNRHGILRLRTRYVGTPSPTDMQLTLYGWVPQENLGLRTQQIELAVNGHVLERFDPPKDAFVHTVTVPRHLLEHSTWVDFTITVANTVRPSGDWRDLGFATTGFQWKPVEGS